MRIWRALKASGAGALRDGVYLLPRSVAARIVFEEQARSVYEVLLTSFGLERDEGLTRLGALVHCLDVGGVPEAAGFAAIMAGARAQTRMTMPCCNRYPSRSSSPSVGSNFV